MAREKKKDVATSLRGLLKDVELGEPEDAKPAPAKAKKKAARRPTPPAERPPSEGLRGDERVAFQDAMMGVRPLREKGPPRPAHEKSRVAETARARGGGSDEEARARLAALVGGAVHFTVERDGERVRGWRAGTPSKQAAELERAGVRAQAALDLHGMTAAEAERAVVRFIRRQHREGVRRVCLVHGKGLHSEGGIGVLGDRVVRALTDGGAAPVVQAFATAPPALGGAGALVVQLTRR